MSDENDLRTWFNYAPIADAGPDYKDDGSQVLLSIWLDSKNPADEKTEMALIGSEQTITLIRIATLKTDGNLSDERQAIIANLTEHMIAILRLIYDPSLDRARTGEDLISLGSFANENGKPNLSVSIKEHVNPDFRVNVEQIKSVFLASSGLRRVLTLLTDSYHPIIPLPFRYLSLYKILELELREHGTWHGLPELLLPHEQEFRSLNISNMKLINFIHHYRDRCAHIKTGKSDEMGLTGLESDDASKVRTFLPLFRRVIINLINQRHSDKILLGT